MSLETFKNKPASKKIIVLELDIPMKSEQPISRLLNYEPGIWFTTLVPENIIVIDEGAIDLVPNPVIDDGYDVGSVKVAGVDYIHVKTFEDLRIQEESYLYDIDTTKLYLHFLDWHQPVQMWHINRIILGQTTGFCDKTDSVNGAYFNGVYYEPRIKSVPTISKTKDPLFFGVLAFQGGSVVLENRDGYFDKFRNANIYRQPARLRLGFDGLEYDEYWKGPGYFIENYARNFQQFTLKLQDIRKALSMPVPPNILTVDDYPNLSDDNAGKPKPILYGPIRNMPLICLNEMDESAAYYQFLVMDTEFHPVSSVTAVYVDGAALTSGQWSLNPATGIITIDDDYCEYNLGDVTADVYGASITLALAVIRDMMYNYGNIAFIPINYDTREWNIAQADSRPVRLYLDEQKPLSEAIEECCVADDVLFFPKDGGVYSARKYDEDRAPTRRIYADEWMGEPQITLDPDKFLSSVRVDYDMDQAEDLFKSYLNTAYEDEVFRRYKSKKTKQIETILATSAGAMAKSETIMALSKEITEIVKRKLKTQHIDMEIMDFVIGSPHTRVGQTEELGVWEVLGVNKNLSSADIEGTFRYVRPYREEPEPDYSQGILWNHKLFGHKLYSETVWG